MPRLCSKIGSGLFDSLIVTCSMIHCSSSLKVEEITMKARMEPQKASPSAYQAMMGLETFVSRSSKLEPSLLELVRMRASQINGCAYCLDMHSKDARARAKANSGSML
jgi:AhpD family alkylhydroperoxidase